MKKKAATSKKIRNCLKIRLWEIIKNEIVPENGMGLKLKIQNAN